MTTLRNLEEELKKQRSERTKTALSHWMGFRKFDLSVVGECL